MNDKTKQNEKGGDPKAGPQSVAAQGGIGGSPNPQNMNNSPSPGGDGVQSAASERANADKGTSQPAQQRVNAAERREQGVGGPDGDKDTHGIRASLIHAPGQVLPYEDEMNAASAIKEAEKEPDELPEATRREMEAGKKALEGRSTRVEPERQNPVDDLETRRTRE